MTIHARPGWKCKLCRQMQTRHREKVAGTGVNFYCDDGRLGVFERFVTNPRRRPQSFCAEEHDLLVAVLKGVQAGRDLSVVTRNPLMKKLAAKIIRMRKKSREAAR